MSDCRCGRTFGADAELCAECAADEIDRLRSALREIAKGEGVFSRDPLTHAENTIHNMKEIARRALEDAADEIDRLKQEIDRWSEVKSYWSKVTGRMHGSGGMEERMLYEQTPSNLAALLDRALKGGQR